MKKKMPIPKPREDVQIDNQPQNLKKYQMYFKRWVIILTLGLYNLNVQVVSEFELSCDWDTSNSHAHA